MGPNSLFQNVTFGIPTHSCARSPLHNFHQISLTLAKNIGFFKKLVTNFIYLFFIVKVALINAFNESVTR